MTEVISTKILMQYQQQFDEMLDLLGDNSAEFFNNNHKLIIRIEL